MSSESHVRGDAILVKFYITHFRPELKDFIERPHQLHIFIKQMSNIEQSFLIRKIQK